MPLPEFRAGARQPDAKSSKLSHSAVFLSFSPFFFRATLFFLKRLTFGYCDISIFSVNCTLCRNLYFAETTQKRVAFSRKYLDKTESQVSECVKILAVSFKRWRNAAIEKIFFYHRTTTEIFYE